MCSIQDELLEALSQLSLNSSGDQKIPYMQQLIDGLNKEGMSRSDCTEKLLEKDFFTHVKPSLTSDDAAEKSKAAELIAEVAKVDKGREACLQQNVVPLFVSLLMSSDITLVIQACRALGNICFEFDLGREAVDKCGGLEKLVDVLKNYLHSNDSGSERLHTVSCGFLLNLSNTHESIQEKAIDQGVIEILKDYLQQHADEENATRMALLSLGNFSDTNAGKAKIEAHRIPSVLMNLIDKIGDNLDTLLEVLGALSESEGVKIELAENSICDQLLSIIKDNMDDQDEDCVHLQKLASDLIVLLLTGDKSMDIIYGQSACYDEIVTWLDLNKPDQLQVSGALSIGNIARNERNCEKLVKDGITEKLLVLLKQPFEKVNVTLQHAVFSALRNMAIPVLNKTVMLKSDVIHCVIPYAKSDMSPVQFKLLGLLRMLVDGQEAAAVQLGTDTEFVSRLVVFCAVDDHAGVKGEACRLLAWLIKHSRSTEVMKTVIQSKGIPHLITMATSEYVLMQNEALVALSLIASSVLKEASQEMISGNLINVLKTILVTTDAQPEILANAVTVVNLIIPHEDLKKKMLEEGFISVLKQPHIASLDILSSQVTKALQALESD